ncbi:MAG: tetratricopeptide repeat protein [Bacteroidia bacterium]|nr:tetratricopeptide repeat protein [Bacteroidia bacterium]MCF8447652.1 tetratricopeptide repeat protein [Bacteroidia bacterium]
MKITQHTGLLSFRIALVIVLLFGLNQNLLAQKDSVMLNTLLVQAKTKMINQPAVAQEKFEEVLRIAKQQNETGVQLEAYKQLAILQSSNGKYPAAREYILAGYSLAEAKGYEGSKADFNYLNASIYHAQGDISKAVEKYLEALRYFESKQLPVGSLNTYLSLADIYSRQNNFTRAIEYNLKALALFEQKNDKFRQLNLYEQIGEIYARQKQFKKADEYYKKALNVYREIGNQAGESASLINLANNEQVQGNTAAAIRYFEMANQIANPLMIVPLEVRSLIGMAKGYYLIKDYEASNITYRKAIVLAKNAGMKIELDEAYEGLAEVYKGLKDPGTSKAYRSLSSEIKDSLFNDSIIRRTTDLQLLYEAEKRQAQLDLLGKEDKLKELDLKQTRQVKNFFIALSTLLVLLIFVFVYFISQNRKINTQLKQGMLDLGAKNVEIEKQKEQLSQLNQVKDRFFSIISHDLRNNLTTMKLYFDLVGSPGYKAEADSQLGKDVAGSVQNTIDLLENLLVWASGQIKGVVVQPKKISLHKLAEENCHMLMSMAVQKNITLTNDTDQDAFIMADVNMVNLILRNLISNALKFTKENGSVTILSQEEEDHHQIIVIDNGLGIGKEKLESLFTAHMNVSTQGTGNEKGTGLGLMLCKEFVERNGGRIWVESEEGKGSSFYFTFPKA